jgi:hypothetical protein
MATIETRLTRLEDAQADRMVVAWRQIGNIFDSLPIPIVQLIANDETDQVPAEFSETLSAIDALFTPELCEWLARRRPPGPVADWTDEQVRRFNGDE